MKRLAKGLTEEWAKAVLIKAYRAGVIDSPIAFRLVYSPGEGLSSPRWIIAVELARELVRGGLDVGPEPKELAPAMQQRGLFD